LFREEFFGCEKNRELFEVEPIIDDDDDEFFANMRTLLMTAQ
jgi:hypothetical protein